MVPEGKDSVPKAEVAAVINELEKIDHLNEYPGQSRVESFANSIRVYLIDQTPEAVADVISIFPEEAENIRDSISAGNVTYTAYMRFIRGEKDRDTYYVDRRMFSGLQKRDEEKWLFVASEKSITEAASKYLPHLEQDSFYELGI